ncbi:hypothetical protein AVEN_115986-1 [Araneus ventricosus]|uniref:Uncharacterized protein n=1 Tax=Araneus ventricosus TaxID=182803 RepID=A0A4Y2RZB0_ARAVE|nr:hypothetical protein AVEN_115986-1 [Araneus ventricosus]
MQNKGLQLITLAKNIPTQLRTMQFTNMNGSGTPSRRKGEEMPLDCSVQHLYRSRNGRYVSAPEAMGRLKELNLSEKPHTIVRLAVHLPDQQVIVYQDGQKEEAFARTATRQTTLTAWFELNKNEQDSLNYLHTVIPHYYKFNKSAMK